MPRADAIREVRITEQTYYRWRKQYGGMHSPLGRIAMQFACRAMVERLWRREGLKVPPKQPKKSRLRLHDGSCIRLGPEYRNHVWSYDFVHCGTEDGKAFRRLNVLDEFSRECLAIRVKRKLNSTDLFILRGPPAYVRSDNGHEFVASLPDLAR